jgi:hypothetical protein
MSFENNDKVHVLVHFIYAVVTKISWLIKVSIYGLIMASDGCNGHPRPLLIPRACNRANMKKAIH